jgi:hypothetical protein
MVYSITAETGPLDFPTHLALVRGLEIGDVEVIFKMIL